MFGTFCSFASVCHHCEVKQSIFGQNADFQLHSRCFAKLFCLRIAAIVIVMSSMVFFSCISKTISRYLLMTYEQALMTVGRREKPNRTRLRGGEDKMNTVALAAPNISTCWQRWVIIDLHAQYLKSVKKEIKDWCASVSRTVKGSFHDFAIQ